MGRLARNRKRTPQGTGSRTSLTRLIVQLHGALSLDLRHRDYAPDASEFYWATLGHCYVAADAIYHIWAKRAGYVPFVLKHKHGTHWWLAHERTGKILDPTEPQLDGKAFPYSDGRKASFLTREPSKRARELIRRIRRK